MRKLTLAAALLGSLFIVGCGDEDSTTASSSSTSLIGSWGLNETVTENGMNTTIVATQTFSSPSALVVKMKATMGGFTLMDTTMSGSWKTSSNLLIVTMGGETDTAVYSIAGNKLTVIETDIEDGEIYRDTTVWTKQ